MELSQQANVYEVLKFAAEQWPHSPAVHDELGTISFDSLFKETEELKKQLAALGLKKGMGMALKARNGRTFIVGLFAGIGCSAVVMPMAHQLKKPEIEEILSESGIQVILDDLSGIPPILPVNQYIELPCGKYSFSFTGADKNTAYAPHVDNPAFVRFTSGTTGKSKGVVVSHQSVIERIEAANLGLSLGPGDTVVWVRPMAYHFIVSIVLYIRFGAAIAVVQDFLARHIINITNQYSGTLLYASPFQIKLLAADTSGERMPTLKRAISTSAGIGYDVCLQFKERFGLTVSQAYGIIEIGLPMLNDEKSEEHPDAVGFALPGYTVDILDDEYKPLPPGKVGFLGIKGPGMFDAYLFPPTPRSAVLKNGYFLTADYATKDPEGLVKIEGRSKSVINISGIKVFPEEIEAVLETFPGIKQARISSSPHPLLGQIIIGELVAKNGMAIDTREVLSFCRERLSAFKIPNRLKIVESLPMTKTGKLQRH
ncbi:MAG: acyl--CoA ligase [Chitinophagaceae bacterium]|nr:acyl--CoA ligase [Chitinophagaceae bacterium]